MADSELTMPDLDPDRHYGALLGGGGNNQIRVRVKCGSTQEVSVSQIGGGFVLVSEEEGRISPDRGGPLLIECEKHGKYIGLLQLMEKSPEDATGSKQLSIPIMLIPLPNVEYVIPYGM